MTTSTIIQLEKLEKIYGKGEAQVRALAGIDLQIGENEFVAIMGPSGSGKSTLMNIIGCLDRPTNGSYHLAGEDVSGLTKTQLAIIRNRRLGFIFQSYNLLAGSTALENVMLPLLYRRNGATQGHRLSAAEQKAKALAALEAVRLSDRTHHLPAELSGGQMQRVAIARALVNDPVVILADEPTGNLDSHSSEEVMGLLVELHANGRTIVMVTHSNEIAAYARRVVRFRDGLIESDTFQPVAQVLTTEGEPANATPGTFPKEGEHADL
jgi:putative ABC transport system ATP-binding protein